MLFQTYSDTSFSKDSSIMNCSKYDINYNTKLSTYAIPYILGNIKKEYNMQNSVISSSYYIKLIKNCQEN